MSDLRSRLRSELPNTPELVRILTKIALLYSEATHRVVFEVQAPNGTSVANGTARYNASACTNVAFAPTNATVAISFQPPGGSLEHYGYTDIQIIRRLRTKKYLIRIKGTANPA